MIQRAACQCSKIREDVNRSNLVQLLLVRSGGARLERQAGYDHEAPIYRVEKESEHCLKKKKKQLMISMGMNGQDLHFRKMIIMKIGPT